MSKKKTDGASSMTRDEAIRMAEQMETVPPKSDATEEGSGRVQEERTPPPFHDDDLPQPKQPDMRDYERRSVPRNPGIADEADQAERELAYAAESLRPSNELSDKDIHPGCLLPLRLMRDRKLMAQYAMHLGRTPNEAQHRRARLKITPKIQQLYNAYRAACEKNGWPFWTPRGYAACLIVHQQGVPLEEPDSGPPQDILDELERKLEQRTAGG